MCIRDRAEELPVPCAVKIVNGGSSIGVALPDTKEQLEDVYKRQASSLPHRHTDFIFSVSGEELGLVGCLLTLALLTAIILRCLYAVSYTHLDVYKRQG